MPETTDLTPLSDEEFRHALVAAVGCFKVEDTRFYQLLATGRCPRPTLQAYARATVRSADLFCATVAEMVDKAPDAEARLMLLENLLEEEGIFLRPSVGLVSRPDIRHPALARRFSASLGVTNDPGDAKHAAAEGRALLARGEWVEAVSHMLVGQELHFADAAPVLAQAFRQNGLTEHDVAFFSVHETADREHGEQALELVVKHARGREQQDRCIAEAHSGARAWMAAHGGPAR